MSYDHTPCLTKQLANANIFEFRRNLDLPAVEDCCCNFVNEHAQQRHRHSKFAIGAYNYLSGGAGQGCVSVCARDQVPGTFDLSWSQLARVVVYEYDNGCERDGLTSAPLFVGGLDSTTC